jgi:DNA-binding CsgD family transcriptional regulator
MSEEEVPEVVTPETEEESWGDRMLVPGRPLSPRHKKLAELLAQGKSNDAIAKELSYTPSRVSILKSNTMIRQEIARVQEKIYEDTVAKRLKDIATPAMDEIETCLKDQTNAYPKSLKVSTAIWAAEMSAGKAVQKSEVTGSILVGVMDRLDAMKNAGRTVESSPETPQIEASPIEYVEIQPTLTKSEEDLLKDWVISFNPK